MAKKDQKHTHKECRCAMCEMGEEKYMEWEREQVAEHGWFAHVVTDCGDDGHPFGFSMHTHYLPESFGATADLEVVLPVDPEIILAVFHYAVDQYLRKGIQFVPGQRYTDILANDYAVEFAWAKEAGRDVLRMIIADRNNITANTDETDKNFRRQWQGTYERAVNPMWLVNHE